MELTTTFTYEGQRIEMVCEDHIMHREHLKGYFYEHPMLAWIHRNVPHGGTWVDVGANVGNHAVFFGKFMADTLVAFEPVERNYQHLRRNLAANCPGPFDKVLQAGAGSEAGTMAYDDPEGGTRWSQVKLSKDGAHTVPVVTIDSLGLKDVRLIKFDCEGMEAVAVLGAIETIRRDLPELFIEIWEDKELSRFKADLGLMGYRLIERFGHAPTYHFSASGRYPVTYRKPVE